MCQQTDNGGYVVYRHNVRRRDTSSQDIAGWLYADVFLALMIVGVGSSVVVRQMIPSDSVLPPPAAANPASIATVSCREFAIHVDAQTADGSDALLADVVTAAMVSEITARRWNVDEVQPALIIVLGGFEMYESAGDGDVSARAFRSRLRRVVPELATVEMRTGGSRSAVVNDQPLDVGNNGEFLLVVYLLHSGEIERECV